MGRGQRQEQRKYATTPGVAHREYLLGRDVAPPLELYKQAPLPTIAEQPQVLHLPSPPHEQRFSSENATLATNQAVHSLDGERFHFASTEFTQANCKAILDACILRGEKVGWVTKIVEQPDKFVGFLHDDPVNALWAHAHRSRSARKGHALERICYLILLSFGFLIPKDEMPPSRSGGHLKIDQLFIDRLTNTVYVGEEKLRDNHDNTKKDGQLGNLREKLRWAVEYYSSAYNIIGFLHFFDPYERKSLKYYERKCNEIGRELGIEVKVFYGDEFFAYLGHPGTLQILQEWYETWRQNRPNLNIDCDLSAVESARDLEQVEAKTWYKLLDNEKLWEKGIVKALFSTGQTLRLVCESLRARGHLDLAEKLQARLEDYYRPPRHT